MAVSQQYGVGRHRILSLMTELAGSKVRNFASSRLVQVNARLKVKSTQ